MRVKSNGPLSLDKLLQPGLPFLTDCHPSKQRYMDASNTLMYFSFLSDDFRPYSSCIAEG